MGSLACASLSRYPRGYCAGFAEPGSASRQVSGGDIHIAQVPRQWWSVLSRPNMVSAGEVSPLFSQEIHLLSLVQILVFIVLLSNSAQILQVYIVLGLVVRHYHSANMPFDFFFGQLIFLNQVSYRCLGYCIWHAVFPTAPSSSELIWKKLHSEALQAWIPNFVETISIQYWYQGAVIGHYLKPSPSPSRKMWHFWTAQMTARSSISIMVYRCSVSVINLNPACTMRHDPSGCCCFNTKPNPFNLLTWTCSNVALFESWYVITGVMLSAFFTSLNARSCGSSHRKSFLGFNRGRNGSSFRATTLVKSGRWFTKPKNDRRSVMFDGLRKLATALCRFGFNLYLLMENMYTPNSTSVHPNRNLL